MISNEKASSLFGTRLFSYAGVFIGDDLSCLKSSDVTAKVLTNLEGARLDLVCNGVPVAPKSVQDGVCTYSLDPDLLKKGMNVFAVEFPVSAPEGTTFNDFSLSTKSKIAEIAKKH